MNLLAFALAATLPANVIPASSEARSLDTGFGVEVNDNLGSDSDLILGHAIEMMVGQLDGCTEGSYAIGSRDQLLAY